jgi:hypothetical protein
MKRMKRITAIVIAPMALVGGLTLATIGGMASGAPVSAESTAHVSPSPDGTPTGCPAPGYLCSYFFTGSGQGSSDICIKATGYVANWYNVVVSGLHCQTNAGALVNTHQTGHVLLDSWTNMNLSGQVACINNGSYYDDLGYNHYPDGETLINNIDSSEQISSGAC